MLTDEQVAEAAAALFRAELDSVPIDPISQTYPDADIADAYRISTAVTDLKVKAGRIVKGHKIGLTSKAMRSLTGATEPDYGTMFDDWFVLEGSAIPRDRMNRPLVEVELAFVLREPLAGPGVNAADVIRATDFILPCMEIVDLRQRGRGPNMLVDSIADAAACGLVVLGGRPARLTDLDIRRIGASLAINGSVEESGVASAVMGNPINAVAWLATKLHEYGVALEAGHVVLSGSFIKAIPFDAGDSVVALFDTLGEVTFHAVRPLVRLGLTLSYPDLGDDPGFFKDLAQAAEEAGFDHLLGAEHVIGGHPDRLRDEKVHTYDVLYHEPFVLFAYLGAVTSRIELATSILILPQRQTALVAKQAAELDVLTGGRLRLGVGVGRNWMEYEALNEDFENRGARIEEQVDVLRRLWTEELVTFDGSWHQLDRMGLNPMPVQRPIPIWMGSYRGKVVDKVIRRIARLADGWFPQLPPGDELGEVLARLRVYAAEAGRDPATIGIEGATTLRADDDPQRWVDEAEAFRALGATHLRVVTAFAGLTTPQDHLDAALRWLTAVQHR